MVFPKIQVSSLGGVLLWLIVAVVGIVALFTTGLGPVILVGVVMVVAAGVVYFALMRLYWHLARGSTV